VKVIVYITPKKNVLDPQGGAIEHAMDALGYCRGKEVRVGKVVEFTVEAEDSEAFRESLDKICHELLSNPVIEDYRYEVATEVQ